MSPPDGRDSAEQHASSATESAAPEPHAVERAKAEERHHAASLDRRQHDDEASPGEGD
ncbi:MAG TPA: hypothetical protein VHE83_02420 [Mycobacteriales bacterium]|nr:hypothetical protein [Mycobacteriales bacterium]